MKRALLALLLCACGSDAGSNPATPITPTPESDASAPPITYVVAPKDVNDVVAPVRAYYGVPAIAALVFQKGTVIAESVDGVRKLGAEPASTTADKFFVGNVIQPMTATLAALLVQRGVLGWDTKLSSLGIAMHASYNDVTLEQLLARRGGVADSLPTIARDGDPRTLRTQALVTALATAATGAGTFQESDASVLAAAALLEAKSGRAFEDLLQTELFAPLGITTCGWVASDPSITQPWGHTLDDLAAPHAYEPGSDPEPPRAYAPARGLRCSLEDWGRFAAFHLRGARGESTGLLSQDAFTKLQAPIELSHTLSWEAVSRTWAGNRLALVYASREASSYAIAWVLPDKETVILAATNQGGQAARKALDDVVMELVGKLVPQ